MDRSDRDSCAAGGADGCASCRHPKGKQEELRRIAAQEEYGVASALRRELRRSGQLPRPPRVPEIDW